MNKGKKNQLLNNNDINAHDFNLTIIIIIIIIKMYNNNYKNSNRNKFNKTIN